MTPDPPQAISACRRQRGRGHPMPATSRLRTALPPALALASAAVTGCGSPVAAETAIRHRIADQVARWNAGDLDGFLAAYWDSPDLTFTTGGRTIRGRDALRERYRSRYPDRAAMGRLLIDDLDVRLLGAEVALVLGRWTVQREPEPLRGRFTLVFRRIGGQWLIVHDHTSAEARAATAPPEPHSPARTPPPGAPTGTSAL